jgi:hypothetical protein
MPSLLIKFLSVSTTLASLGAALPHQKQEAQQQKQQHQQQACQGAPAQQMQGAMKAGKAVYFVTNEQKNAVVALPIGKDGKLSKGSMTCTGGAGSVSIDGANGKPAETDALIGQSSLTVVGNVSQIKSSPCCRY